MCRNMMVNLITKKLSPSMETYKGYMRKTRNYVQYSRIPYPNQQFESPMDKL